MKPPVNMELKKEIAIRLKEVRLELGLNQQQMADSLGVSRQHINRLEAPDAEKMPSHPFVARVSKLAGVNEDWLYYGKGKKYMRDSVIDLRAHEKAAELSSSLINQTNDYIYLKSIEVLKKGDLTGKQYITYFQLFSSVLEIIFEMMFELKRILEKRQDPARIIDNYSIKFKNCLTDNLKDFD